MIRRLAIVLCIAEFGSDNLLPAELQNPCKPSLLIKVIKGMLQPWMSQKKKVPAQFYARQVLNHACEFSGPGVDSLSMQVRSPCSRCGNDL